MEEKKYLIIDGKQTKIENLTGRKFNRLTVVEFDEERYKKDIIRKENKEIKYIGYYWLCQCNCVENKIISILRGNLIKGYTTSCGCIRLEQTKISNSKFQKKSFKVWCIENNKRDLLKLWNYDLNNKNPDEVGYMSNLKFYFKCPRNLHESEAKKIINLVELKNSNICSKCNSFAQWGIDNICEDFLEKYWDYNKNTVNPWEITKSSKKGIFIQCSKVSYHESYYTLADSFSTGNRCSYCKKTKIHKLDSLGSVYPEVLNIWSDKNNKSPYEIAPKARRKYWFKCENGIHKDYLKAIYSGADLGFRCPECNTSKGEQRVAEFLINNKINYIFQYEYSDLIGVNGGNLRFDFALSYLNINIEYDGEGHYMPIDFDGDGRDIAEEKFRIIKHHDKLKNEYCKKHKIKLIRIPYWDFDNIEEILKKELKLN